jgi:hypothetical protein
MDQPDDVILVTEQAAGIVKCRRFFDSATAQYRIASLFG